MEKPDDSPTEAVSARSILRLLVGLLIGFIGVFVTLQAVDYFEPDAAFEPLEVVLGVPDFEGYCTRDDPQLRGVATTGDAFGWQCVGLVDRLWTTQDLTANEVCRWEYGPTAFARLADESEAGGWICAGDP